jgi:F-type H+-transporting ATPase subunit b
VRNRLTSSASNTSRRIRSLPAAGVIAGAGLSAVSGLIAHPVLASDNLELVPDPFILSIMVVVFLLLIFPLNQLIFKPIFHSLDERAARIEGARRRSTLLQREADGVLDRYETAIREARGESEQARQAQLSLAREEQATLTTQARSAAEGELERARADLRQSLEEARASLRSSAEDLATAAAEQVLGRTLS